MLRIVGVEEISQRGMQVRVISLEGPIRGELIGAEQPREKLLGLSQEMQRMRALDVLEVARLAELLERELSDDLEHPVARDTATEGRSGQQAVIDQRGEHARGSLNCDPRDGRERVGAEAAQERSHPCEHPAPLRIEQLIAPRDHPAHRTLPLGCVDRPIREECERTLESVQHLRERERLHSGRGELDRERQVIEPIADRGDREPIPDERRVACGRAIDEEIDRGSVTEGRDA